MTTQKDIVSTEFPRNISRYYCRGAHGPAGHCDDRPQTIQCDYCIWFEVQRRVEIDHPNTCRCEECRFWS